MNEKQSVTASELSAFVAAISKKISDHDRASFSNPALIRTVEACPGGRKFARLATVSLGSRSAYLFIDLTTGDILKPDGWKSPAKGARGNIRAGSADNWWNGACGPYGAAYLR